MKTKCILCNKEFEDVNYEKLYGNELNIRIYCNECITKIYQEMKGGFITNGQRR